MIRKLIPQFESLPAAEQQALLNAAMQAAYEKLTPEEKSILSANAEHIQKGRRGFGDTSAMLLQMQVGIVLGQPNGARHE